MAKAPVAVKNIAMRVIALDHGQQYSKLVIYARQERDEYIARVMMVV